MSKLKFEYEKGFDAYLRKHIYSHKRESIRSIMLFEVNLELFVTNTGIIVAERSEPPEDMRHLLRNYGKWVLTEDIDLLADDELCRLKLLLMDYNKN